MEWSTKHTNAEASCLSELMRMVMFLDNVVTVYKFIIEKEIPAEIGISIIQSKHTKIKAPIRSSR